MTGAAREVVLVLLALPIGDDRPWIPLDHLARNEVSSCIGPSDIGSQRNGGRIRHWPRAGLCGRGLGAMPFFGFPFSCRLSRVIQSQTKLKVMNHSFNPVPAHG